MGEPLLLSQDVLNLLHRAADAQSGQDSEALTPAELAQLSAVPTEVQQAYLAAWGNVEALRTCSAPALPHSLAAAVAAEVALSAQLQHAPAAPPVPSQASHLAADIALSAQLKRGRPLPHTQAAALAGEIALAAQLQAAPPPLPSSSAAFLAARIAHSAGQRPQARAVPAAGRYSPHPAARRDSRSAPLALVGSLITGLLLLTVTSSWDGLSAGAGVLRGLLGSLPPTFGVGLVLLLGTSLLVARQPEFPTQARPVLTGKPLWSGAAFAVAALLTFPTLYGALDSQGISVGKDLVIEGQHRGPVIALGGDIHLRSGSVVTGEVFTLLGDIYQDSGAQVGGQVTALLGQDPEGHRPNAPDQSSGPLSDLQLASATAIRPLLGWLGGAAWGALFWVLTSTLTLTLFVSGTASRLARRQRQAPLRTLALGVLALAALLVPATVLTFAGWLVPALGLCLLLTLLLGLGLGVSAFDIGRQLADRLHARVPDTLGVVIALALLSACLAWPPAALAVILIGGAWGSGSLLLIRRSRRTAKPQEELT
ncbi:hypothetical protein GCM10017783_16620 [Deinococcus piscis]|uniref:Polymer-forming cytoskeletal protein n=1 Tax=Deinococcus piscis TaxID=394230 RepID=A0ABQ3KCJ1_9DEIO|nr:polymer-forming cytoskeletal protein [Deinococcus piscis]GHG04658.1 hypothetical protein GCM10017783_16620 [Deinococcus piscis]